jgi:hypothetical protein
LQFCSDPNHGGIHFATLGIMSRMSVAPHEWQAFLRSFTRKHHGEPVTVEVEDLMTDEHVDSPSMSLRSIELDLEEEKNPRINVTLQMGHQEIKQILYRPTELTFFRSDGGDEAIRILSVNTFTTVRLRAAAKREESDEVA